MIDLSAIHNFLRCATPTAWLTSALADLSTLLIDHANCEKKAASSAMTMLYRYEQHTNLLHKMSRLAREELRHFEQVVSIMQRRGVAYRVLSPARYASELHRHVRTHEPAKLIDTLIVGAFIEARSCERFACLAPHLDDELQAFYTGLLTSEARHFQDYLALAEQHDAKASIAQRIEHFAQIERQLIESPDNELRFHSGPVG